MSGSGFLLGLAIAFPLILMLAQFSAAARRSLPMLLPLAPVPALVVAIMAGGARFELPAPFRLTLALDGPGAFLLGAAALIWIAAGLYAPAYWRGSRTIGRAAAWWLLTLTGSLGVFVAADLVSFYLLFSLVSLAGYGLVVLDGHSAVRRAGSVYVAFAVLGEAFLLMAFALLAANEPSRSLAIADVVAALPTSPWRDWTLLLLVLGFGVKIAMLPLHVWMPLAYTAAPIPAAAVLSGAAVKAGVIGLIRFLPFGVELPDWGAALTTLGLLSAFYGVAIGITQRNPKTILAYSSISQMGVIAAVAGMAMAGARGTAPIEIAFYAVHHVLAKGGLFLAIGVVALTGRCRLWPVLVPAAIVALGIAGLPLTGGGLAKLAVKDAMGYGLVGWLGKLSAVASALLMIHFLRRLAEDTAASDRPAPARLVLVWWGVAAASIALPWLLYPLTGQSLAATLSPGALWDGVWPIAIGGLLAIGLGRFEAALPAIPAGDILVPLLRLRPLVARLGDGIVRTEATIREWPVAGALFAALVLLIGAAMYLAGGP